MPPFATFPRMELQTSASLPGEERQKSGTSSLRFFPFSSASFLSSLPFSFLPNTAFFSSGGHHANANWMQPKKIFSGDFSTQNDWAENAFRTV